MSERAAAIKNKLYYLPACQQRDRDHRQTRVFACTRALYSSAYIFSVQRARAPRQRLLLLPLYIILYIVTLYCGGVSDEGKLLEKYINNVALVEDEYSTKYIYVV